jgi:hypothetical protein
MRRSGVLVIAVALSAAGCYRLQPVVGPAPATGSQVAVYVNDAGRAALSVNVGSSIERIEGRLSAQDAAGYAISVKHVYFLRGGVQIWSGESVRIPREHVESFAERRISKGRTLALGAAGAGSIGLMFASGLLGSGLGDPPGTPSDSGDALRWIWP